MKTIGAKSFFTENTGSFQVTPYAWACGKPVAYQFKRKKYGEEIRTICSLDDMYKYQRELENSFEKLRMPDYEADYFKNKGG